MYKLILQRSVSSEMLYYNLAVSKINQNNFGSNLEIVGKYIVPFNNKATAKKLVIYKLALNKWLSRGLQINVKTKHLLKEAGLLK